MPTALVCTLTINICVLAGCKIYPPLYCAEVIATLFAVTVLGFIHPDGLNLRRRELRSALAVAASVFLLKFSHEIYIGTPSLVGEKLFATGLGIKHFNNGTSAYPPSIFEEWFPPFEANASDCRYVRVSGAREQWQSNGLYVKTGECDGKNHYECTNCYYPLFPVVLKLRRHLSFDGGWLRRWYVSQHGCHPGSVRLLSSGCSGLFDCSMQLNYPPWKPGTSQQPARWVESLLFISAHCNITWLDNTVVCKNERDRNPNITVECVDEEFRGPGYRNATRRAWTWLSSNVFFDLTRVCGHSSPICGIHSVSTYGSEHGILDNLLVTYIALFVIACFTLLIGGVGGLFSLLDVVCSFLYGLGQVRHRSLLFLRRACARYDRILDNARLRRALAAERARADRLAVELATLRGMNHMCTALANRVGAYNS